MLQNITQFGIHDRIQILASILLRINSSPRRANDEGISLERLYRQKILIIKLYLVDIFVIDFKIVLEHLYFVLINVIDNVLTEGVR